MADDMYMIADEEKENYETFRECLGEVILKALAAPGEEETKRKKRRRDKRRDKGRKSDESDRTVNDPAAAPPPPPSQQDGGHDAQDPKNTTEDAEDLGDFIDVS